MTHCALCGVEVDPSDPNVYRKVAGWERKGIGGGRKGGSDVFRREPTGEVACTSCITRLRSGVGVDQESMF